MTDEKEIQEAKTKVKETFDECAAAIVDGQRSLTARLVRAYRCGALDEAKAEMVFTALRQCVSDGWNTYKAAIAQPAPKVSIKSRITL